MINNTKHFGYTVGHGVQVAKYIKRRLALMAYPNNFSIVKALAERLNVLMSSLLMEFLFVAKIFFVHIRMLKITFQIMDFDLKFLLMLNLGSIIKLGKIGEFTKFAKLYNHSKLLLLW